MLFPVVANPKALLQKQRIEVAHDGPMVTLKIGNATLTMEYELAIQLSTWLRVHGKRAKAEAGDTSRHWTVIGNLTAAENGERPW